MGALGYDVLVTLAPRTVLQDGSSVRQVPAWSPISSTVIYGEHDAILIDAPHTIERAGELVQWLAAHDKNLVAMYATHGHGDHWFGFSIVAEKFPQARLLGTEGTVALAREQGGERVQGIWRGMFPGQLPETILPLQVVDGPSFWLEGHEIRFVEAGRSDTRDTTFVHVPELGLVVAGDIIYNQVHLYLGETDAAQRQEWIAAVD